MRQLKPKTATAVDVSERSQEIEKEIGEWRVRIVEQRDDLAAIERRNAEKIGGMETFLLASAKGNAEAEIKLAEIEFDISLADMHRKRVAATVAKIEAEIIRLETERQAMLKQEAAWRIENRMGEVANIMADVWKTYGVIESAIKRLWEITRQDQIDGSTVGLNNVGTSRQILHTWHLVDLMDRLKSHADKNAPLGHEDFKQTFPEMLAASQATLQRDINNALGRTETESTKAA